MKQGACAMAHRAKSFFKTPKGLVTIILVIFTAMSAPGQGIRAVAAGLGTATIAAGPPDGTLRRPFRDQLPLPPGTDESKLPPPDRAGIVPPRLSEDKDNRTGSQGRVQVCLGTAGQIG